MPYAEASDIAKDPPGVTKGSASRIAFTFLKLGVSVALMWLLLRNIEMQDVLARIAGLPLWALLAALTITVLQLFLIAGRWMTILQHLKHALPLLQVTRFTLEGFFFNQSLPSSIGGDAIRMLRSAQVMKSVKSAIASVLLDRFFGVLGLILLVSISQIWLQRIVDNPPVQIALALTVVFGIASVATFLAASLLPEVIRQLKMIRPFTTLAVTARQLVFGSKSALIIFLSVCGHVFSAAIFFVLAKGLGIALTFADCVLLIPVSLLVTIIPISIAGWGLRENAVVVMLGFAGVGAEAALSLSVLFGLIYLVVALPGGFLWLKRPRVQTAPQTD